MSDARLSPAPEAGPARGGGSGGPRLRWSAPLAGALLGLLAWGGVKVAWEQRIGRGEVALRYHGNVLTRQISDQLGQGTLIGLLGGLRAVVANYYWLEVTNAWEKKDWPTLRAEVDLVTALQPRTVLFWEMGAWHLAWNASVDKLNNIAEKSQTRREADARKWVEMGRDVLLRGVENIPDRYNLWFQLGWIEDQKFHDELAAAHYYQEALKRPGAPRYLERFVGYDLETGGDKAGAYAWWKDLWRSAPDHADKVRAWDKVEDRIRRLENELKVPDADRLFPAGSPRQAYAPPGTPIPRNGQPPPTFAPGTGPAPQK